MGFHILDIVVVVGIALLIFGPKTLQSISHNAGRGVGQAKEVKDQMLAELPMEDLSKVRETVSQFQIPLNPQQAARKFVTSTLLYDEKQGAVASEVTNETEEV